MNQPSLLLLALFAVGCTGAGGAQRQTAAARGALDAGLQQPYYTEADVAELRDMLLAEPILAAQLQTEEEQERLLACIVDEASTRIPSRAAAIELGQERLDALNHAIGEGCMQAHRTEVLLGEVWSESFPAVYASECEANEPELSEMCHCIAAQAPLHFESPASFNQLEQVLESDQEPDSDQQARFQGLIEACGEAVDEER